MLLLFAARFIARSTTISTTTSTTRSTTISTTRAITTSTRKAAVTIFLVLVYLIPLVICSHAIAADQPINRTSMPIERITLVHKSTDELNVKIDGRLDENVWATLPVMGDFATIEPDTLIPGKHPTIVKMFYTDRGIYVAYDLYQPKDTLVARLSSRDQRSINRDGVYITFDSSGEGRYGYWFGITLGGSLQDGTLLAERRYTPNWDGAWWGATAETYHGWSAEMFIPWSLMTMPKRENIRNIGVYISRKVAYLNERWAWPALPETKSQFISVLDQLQVEDVSPRQQYNFFPYSSVTFDEVKSETVAKAGADLFWRPSTNFQLAATLKPDFGSVESDDVIVNLSATETFFPEKRLFFLEGQEVFVATPRANDTTPTTVLNTRRIGGLAAAPDIPAGVTVPSNELGQPANLNGAVKATGQSGEIRYGFLSASEENTEFVGEITTGGAVDLEQDGRDFSVARAIYEDSVGGATRGLGWMSTAMVHPDREAYVHAVDGHYLSANGKWQADGQVIYSDVDVLGEGGGGFVDVQYIPAQGKTHSVDFEYFDKEIDINDLGFLRRNNVYGFDYKYESIRSDISFGRDASSVVMLLQKWNTDRQTTKAGFFWDGVLTRDDLTSWELRADYYPQRFEDLNSFGNGTFKIEERGLVGIGYNTDSSKKLSLQIDLDRRGEEVGGHHIEAAIAVTYRPVDRLSTVFKVNHKDREGWLLHRGGQNMTTFDAEEWKYRWDFDFFFTARQQFRASFQWVGIRAYENDYFQIVPDEHLVQIGKPPSEEKDKFTLSNLNFQLRYRWEIAPMSDLFVVYTKNGNEYSDPNAAEDFDQMFSNTYHNPSSEQLVFKLRYRLGS